MFKESNFIKNIIQQDLENQKYKKIITRFPPEPNGFLHLGHARAIIINFELAKIFNGQTYLRFDDTNPYNEKQIYIDAILEDIKWLGYCPDKILFASDYFEKMYEKAILLIRKGKAFVDDLTTIQLKENRGNLNQPGNNSPFRERTISENLELFIKMQKGFFKKGEKVLRAKIDMASPNINMRDPVLYRILDSYTLKKKHYFIFPSYDFAHPLEDSIEGITHSLCSLEFEDHRPLYEWILKETEMSHLPRQIEFGRLNITQTFLSKRNLKFLVEQKLVTGWDDPRMPTLRGVKKRGYKPEVLKKFVIESGIAKTNTFVDKKMLDFFLRNNLQIESKKAMAVIEPLKVTILNYPDDKQEFREIPFHDKLDLGIRKVFFAKNIYIEKSDFQLEKSDSKSKKLFLNGEVRLFHFYFIKAIDFIRDEKGQIIEILALYDPQTKSGNGFNERKPNGTIHFVEQKTAQKAFFNFYGPLFLNENPTDLKKDFNHNSWQQTKSLVEGSINFSQNNQKFQFLRNGYFNLSFKNQVTTFHEIISLKNLHK